MEMKLTDECHKRLKGKKVRQINQENKKVRRVKKEKSEENKGKTVLNIIFQSKK